MLEFSYPKLTEEQTEAYLKRIGCKRPLLLTRDTLNELVYAHQCTVPFENLTLFCQHEPIVLDTEILFEKIVTNRRGGYCFELNSLFVSLLTSLGFDVYSVMVRLQTRSEKLRPYMHRGCIARIGEKRYFFDVGFGGPMAPFAVELNPEKQTFHEETYWAEPFHDACWCLYRERNAAGYNYIPGEIDNPDSRLQVAVFSLAPALNEDFIPLNRLTSIENPESNFVKRLFVNLRTEDGYLSLMGDTFTEFHKGTGKTVRKVFDREAQQIIESRFGLINRKERHHESTGN